MSSRTWLLTLEAISPHMSCCYIGKVLYLLDPYTVICKAEILPPTPQGCCDQMRHTFKHLAQFSVPSKRSVKIRSCYCCQQKNPNSLPYLTSKTTVFCPSLPNFSFHSSLPSIQHLLTNITSVGSSKKLRSFPDPTRSLLLLPSSFISWGLPGPPFDL